MQKILVTMIVGLLCLFTASKAQAQWLCTGTIFNDVNAPPLLPEFCDNIERFSALGVTKGCVGDDPETPGNEAMYCPDLSLTRSQMAVFFMRALDNLIQKKVTGFCPAGQYISQINPDGTVECGTPDGTAYDSRFVNEGQANSITNAMILDGSVTDAKVTGPISGSKISSTGLNADTVDGRSMPVLLLLLHMPIVVRISPREQF